MKRIPGLSIIDTHIYQMRVTGSPYTIMLIHTKDDEFDIYLKKDYEEGSSPFMFMYAVPAKQQPLSEAITTAAVVAEDYDFLFDDALWLTPTAVPVFHPDTSLYQCGECGDVIETSFNYCPNCAYKLDWKSLMTKGNQ